MGTGHTGIRRAQEASGCGGPAQGVTWEPLPQLSLFRGLSAPSTLEVYSLSEVCLQGTS